MTSAPAEKKAAAFAELIPPVATNRAWGNGPDIAVNQAAPSTAAGNAFSQENPARIAHWISDAVATPGRVGRPASIDSRATSSSKPGLTVKAAPSSATRRTCARLTTVTAPTRSEEHR